MKILFPKKASVIIELTIIETPPQQETHSNLPEETPSSKLAGISILSTVKSNKSSSQLDKDGVVKNLFGIQPSKLGVFDHSEHDSSNPFLKKSLDLKNPIKDNQATFGGFSNSYKGFGTVGEEGKADWRELLKQNNKDEVKTESIKPKNNDKDTESERGRKYETCYENEENGAGQVKRVSAPEDEGEDLSAWKCRLYVFKGDEYKERGVKTFNI